MDLSNHCKECDERIAAEQQKIQPGGEYGAGR